MSTIGRAARRIVIAAAIIGLSVAAMAAPAPAAAHANWSAYLHGPRHSSYEPNAAAITPSNTGHLTRRWSWQPTAKSGTSPYLFASPTTYDGVIYIGAYTGDFYALRQSTGKVIWRKVLPYLSPGACNNKGIASTAAVTTDPVTHALTVYVAAADHYLYALDPATGATRWRSVVGDATPHYYNWSSPTVSGGRIYVGIAGACEQDNNGGVAAYNQHTGALIGVYRTAPGATSGVPTIYTSVAASSDSVYATTGDGTVGDAYSIVRLRATDLAKLEAWKIPNPSEDGDFNASPAFFDATLNGVATTMVGACNKNGIYYAWRANDISAGPVWTRRLGIPNDAFLNQLRFCGGSSAWDFTHKRLLVGANQTTNTTTKLGSVYSLNPSTGAVRWFRTFSAGPVIGSVSLNGSGVLAVPTYNTHTSKNAVYLYNAANGALLRTITVGAPEFAQPVFSDNYLLIANTQALSAYAP